MTFQSINIFVLGPLTQIQVRNKASAWRVIAYIPQKKNFKSQAQLSRFPPEVKTFRLQQLYKAALSSLVEAQKPNALDNVKLQLDRKSKIVNLKIPVMYIIGDLQGGDTLSGCKSFFGMNAKRISRSCDAGPKQLANPRVGSCNRLP